MGRVIKLKPVLNKKNGQMSLCFPKKKMPASLRKFLKKNPESIKSLKFKFEGFD